MIFSTEIRIALACIAVGFALGAALRPLFDMAGL